MRRDWTDVEETLDLKRRDDDLAEAMSCHVRREIVRAKDKVERM